MAIERIIHPIWSHWIGRRRLHCFLSLSLTHSHQHSSFSQTFFFNPLETNLRTYYYYLVSHTFTPMLYTQALLTKAYLRTYVLKFFISFSLSLFVQPNIFQTLFTQTHPNTWTRSWSAPSCSSPQPFATDKRSNAQTHFCHLNKAQRAIQKRAHWDFVL